METIRRFLTTTLLVFCLTSFPSQTINANSVLDANPNAELYVQEQILAGKVVDLAEQFPNASERVIRGEFLSSLLKSEELKSQTSIVIKNAIISSDLNVELSTLPFDIFFDICQFNGDINFIRTETGEFKIANSTVSGFLRMDRAELHGDLVLENSEFQNAVGMSEITVEGDLLGMGSQFLGTELGEGMDYPFELYRANVSLAADFSESRIVGASIFDNAHFDEIYFTNTVFNDEANFNDAVVETNAMFEGTVFEGAANFNNMYTGNYINFNKVLFKSDAVFDFSTSERFMDFIDTQFEKSASFYYTTAGWLDVINTNFKGAVNFEGIHVLENFEINDSQYTYADEPFYFYLANIEGAAWLRNFSSPSGVYAAQSHFSNFEYASDISLELQTLDISFSKIENELLLENVAIKSFMAQNLEVGQATILKQVNITDELDLRNGNIGHLQTTNFQWPNDSEAFNLQGMTYTDIDLGEQGLNEKTWKSLLLLVNQSAYSPQAYKSLSQFLMDRGHADWAGEVELAGKRRARNETMQPFSGPWLWSWFLDIFVGYGHRPFLAFLWSVCVIAFGTFVFRREEDMVIMDTSEAKPVYNPILYSLVLFIPFIEFEIESKWEPKGSRVFASYYKYIHRILGWILLPIALLTFGGIIG